MTTYEMDYNYTLCRMFKIHVEDFFDNIHIPFDYFKVGEWDIENIISANPDALFYNEMYMTDKDKLAFDEIYEKYTKMINGIMNPGNKLYEYLYKWTNFDGKWRKRQATPTILQEAMNEFKYISPIYILNVCTKLIAKHTGPDGIISRVTLKTELYQNLESLMKKIDVEVDKFKEIYHHAVNRFVYRHPINYNYDSNYAKGFINRLILEILDLAQFLIDNNIYAVHAVIREVIDEYTPLDMLNSYEPTEYDGRNIYVV
jgi:hypothetical protein